MLHSVSFALHPGVLKLANLPMLQHLERPASHVIVSLQPMLKATRGLIELFIPSFLLSGLL